MMKKVFTNAVFIKCYRIVLPDFIRNKCKVTKLSQHVTQYLLVKEVKMLLHNAVLQKMWLCLAFINPYDPNGHYFPL